jgi:hypothetical protein
MSLNEQALPAEKTSQLKFKTFNMTFVENL